MASNNTIEATNNDATEFCENCMKSVAAKNYVIHSAHCQRNIKLCKFCKEPFPTKELEEHVLNSHSPTICEKCLDPMEQWQLERHKMDYCKKRPSCCHYCELNLPFDEMFEHENYCGSRTQTCAECRQFVMLKDKKRHNEECKKLCEISGKASAAVSAAFAKSFPMVRESFPSSNPFSTNYKYNHHCYGSSSTSSMPETSSVKKNDSVDYKQKEKTPLPVKKRDDMGTNFKRLKKGLNDDEMKALIDQTKDVFVTCYICSKRVLKREIKEHTEDCSPIEHSLQERFIPDNCSSRYNLMPPSYEDVVKDKPWLSPCQTEIIKKEEDASKMPFKLKTEECPVCFLQFTPTVLSVHIQYCSERTTMCRFCKSFILILEKDDHERTCEANKIKPIEETKHPSSKLFDCDPDYEDDYTVYGNEAEVRQNNSLLTLEAESEMCPFCLSQIPSIRFEFHLKYCSEKKIPCNFCKSSVFVLEHEDHLRNCDKVKANATSTKERQWVTNIHSQSSFSEVVKNSANAAKDSPREETSVERAHRGNFFESIWSQNISDSHEAVKNVEPETCIMCDKTIHTTDKTNHMKHCLKKSHVCRFCAAVVLPVKFKQHIDNDCKEFEKKKWEIVGASGKRKKKAKGLNYPEYFIKNTDYEQYGATSVKVEPIMLPCEFCEELFSEEEIILHQSGCRPDLVSYNMKANEEDFSARYEDNKTFSDNPATNRVRNWKLNTNADATPGEYLSVHPPIGGSPRTERNTPILKEHLSKSFNEESKKSSSENNTFNHTLSSYDEKFIPKTLLQERCKDKNTESVEPFLEYFNRNSDEEPDDSIVASFPTKYDTRQKNKMTTADKFIMENSLKDLSLGTPLYNAAEGCDYKYYEQCTEKNYKCNMMEGAKPKNSENVNRSSKEVSSNQETADPCSRYHGANDFLRTNSNNTEEANSYRHQKKEYYENHA